MTRVVSRGSGSASAMTGVVHRRATVQVIPRAISTENRAGSAERAAQASELSDGCLAGAPGGGTRGIVISGSARSYGRASRLREAPPRRLLIRDARSGLNPAMIWPESPRSTEKRRLLGSHG
ncbi:hypothetical protein ABE10_25510 [Bacillus toyonensis]|nr:hypothetical protein [Bacillus toyonensis]